MTVTAEQITAAKATSMREVDLIAECCNQTGARFYMTLAMLEKETTTVRNVYGGDVGGTFSNFKDPVTECNYRAFRHEVIVRGRTSNGVGPSQITSRDLLRRMEEQGLKPWVMKDNIAFGATLIYEYYRHARDQLDKTVDEALWYAGKRYNGDSDYADAYVEVAKKWKARVGFADYS